ncbi:hypothetical protein EON64_17950 [archaeon]|nr:MAG: hypothetical protein EON64_17950 [archaeon]
MIGIILGSAAALAIGLLACITCCCCCCAPAFCALFSWRPPKPDPHFYQSVRTTPTGNVYTPSAEDVPIVEAYVVPPLAAVNPKPSSSTISTMLDETVAHPVESHTGFRDVWAAVLFLLQLAVMVYFAVQSGYSLRHEGEEDSYVDMRTATALVLLVSLCSTVCFGMSSTLFGLIVARSDLLISFMLYLNIFITLCVCVACLLSAQIVGALIFGAITVFNYMYAVAAQDRIPFASAMLRTACTALKARFFLLLLTSCAALGLQLLFCALWSVAVVYVYQRWQMETAYTQGDDEDVSAEFSGYYVLLLFSLYWTLQVSCCECVYPK